MTDLPVCRLVEPADCDRLQALAISNNFDLDLDWSGASPYWLIAEMGGEMVGAIQLSPGNPIGRMEFLFVEKSMRKRSRALTVRGLTTLGATILAKGGAQIVCGMIDEEQDSFAKVAERRGWHRFYNGKNYAKRMVVGSNGT